MQIRIYHTNDIHSDFERMARIATYLKANKREQDYYVDCGDLCDLKDVMVHGTDGKGAIALLESMNCDAMAIGNNEVDLENGPLSECASGQVPLLSCNLVANDGSDIANIRKSVVIEKSGIRILFIGTSPYYTRDGVTNTYNVFFMMGNTMSIDPVPEIRKELDRNKGKYDYCILLSHSGIDSEHHLLEAFPEIDLCLGGHSHSLCTEERYSQTGKFGEHLGVVELMIEDFVKQDSLEQEFNDESYVMRNQAKFKVVGVRQELLTNSWEKDKKFLEDYEKQRRIAEENLDQTLYEVETLNWDVEHENELTNFIADALFYEYKCDFAFINAGIVEGPIGGKISKKKLIELSPSKLNPTRFPVEGRNLKEAVLHSLDTEFVHQDGHGPGVRGNVLGTLGFSHNVRIQVEPLRVWMNEEELDENRIYDCVACDALQRGTGYQELKTSDDNSIFYRGFIRDLLERTLNNEDLHKSCKLKRIIEENRNK